MRKAVQNKLSTYRYEFLLFALLLLIFDKIFFLESEIYLRFVWPFNMIIISIACYGITIDHNKILKVSTKKYFWSSQYFNAFWIYDFPTKHLFPPIFGYFF